MRVREVWQVPPVVGKELQGLPYIVSRLLSRRGITQDIVHEFIEPCRYISLHQLPRMRGIDAVVRCIASAIQEDKRILIYGDYDADGLTGASIIFKSIRKYGGKATCFIPTRQDGYGLKSELIERFLPFDILVAIDCGVAAHDEVRSVKNYGVNEVVIIDHHVHGENIPDAVVVSPKLLENKEEIARYGDMSASGLSFLVALGLAIELGEGEQEDLEVVDDNVHMACLGTLGDMVSMKTIANRWIVSYGVDAINHIPTTQIEILAEKSGIHPLDMTSLNIPFTLIPRINAVGRINNPMTVFRFLVSEDKAEIKELAERINQTNKVRRDLQNEYFQIAREIAENRTTYSIVIHIPECPKGIAGLVASNLFEEYGVPVVVLSGDTYLSGSVRAPGEIHAYEMLDACSDILGRYGGHACAGGVSLKLKNLERFKDAVEQFYLEMTHYQDGEPVVLRRVDDVLRLVDVDIREVESLRKYLMPYGQDNPEPVFLVTKARLKWAKEVGNGHLSAIIEQIDDNDATARVKGIGWGLWSRFREVDRENTHGLFDLEVQLRINTWNDAQTPQAVIRKLATHDKRNIYREEDDDEQTKLIKF